MTRVGLHCAPMAHQALHTMPHGTIRFAFSTSIPQKKLTAASMGCENYSQYRIYKYILSNL